MNKYLLLRDNRQSGPYTVTELIAKGIKPYDLVWLEGKSAAWRYPSEIEELKAHAPVVEEQPFDRFYKKPEVVKQEAVAEHLAKYQPKTPEIATAEPIVLENPGSSKKVYINFPGAVKKDEPKPIAASAPKSAVNVPAATSSSVLSDIPAPVPSFSKEASYESSPAAAYPERITPVHIRTRRGDNTWLYVAAAACLLLIMMAGFLVINYKNQRDKLADLNQLVQQMQQREKQTAQVIPASAPAENNPPVAITAPDDHGVPAVSPASYGMNVISHSSEKKVPVKKNAKDNIVAAQNAPVKSVTENNPAANDPALEAPVESSNTKNTTSENVYKLVKVKPGKFKTGLLGGISNLQLELTNNSQQELHKVAVQVSYYGPEKKLVNTQTVYFENVSAGAQVTLDVPKSRRGVTVDCTVTDIKS